MQTPLHVFVNVIDIVAIRQNNKLIASINGAFVQPAPLVQTVQISAYCAVEELEVTEIEQTEDFLAHQVPKRILWSLSSRLSFETFANCEQSSKFTCLHKIVHFW